MTGGFNGLTGISRITVFGCLAAALTAHFKDNFGVSAQVAVAEPGTVPRSAGKARRVTTAAD